MDAQIKEILGAIERDRALEKALRSALRSGGPVNITGLCEQQKGYIAAAISLKLDKKPVIIAPDFSRARALAEGLSPFTGKNVIILKPAELSLVSAIASSFEAESERAGLLAKFMSRDFDAAIICAGALLNKQEKASVYKKKFISLKLGATHDPVDLAGELTDIGYIRASLVSAQGEFSMRGDVVDVFPPDSTLPVRLSFFDDEIDQIKYFNPRRPALT